MTLTIGSVSARLVLLWVLLLLAAVPPHTAFVPQHLSRQNDISSRGFGHHGGGGGGSSRGKNACGSPLPTEGCPWGLTLLHVAKSKSGTLFTEVMFGNDM